MFNLLLQFWRRLLFYLRRDKFDRELEEEMRFHLEMKAGENLQSGMPEQEALQTARRQFGNQTLLQEASRGVWGIRSVETFLQDVRYGLRVLGKNKGFTALAVITLAMGLGATTAIFSVVDAVLLRPLAFRDSERLVKVFETDPKRKFDRMMISPGDFNEWKNRSQSFEGMASLSNVLHRVTGTDAPEDVEGVRVSADLFSLLGVRPAEGRLLLLEDQNPDAQRVAVLSHAYWVSRFAADPQVLGRTILLDEKPHVVVGVLPPNFRQTFQSFPGRAQIWTTVVNGGAESLRHGGGGNAVIARLKAGVSINQARAEMAAIAGRLAEEYPKTNAGIGAAVYWLRDEVTGASRETLMILAAAVALTLLIACANVAGLMLSRGIEREKEMAIRAAIGAGRWRVMRQLLTESVLLSLCGGLAGVLLAKWMLTAITPLIPRDVPRTDEITMDYRVLLFALAASLISVLLFGLAPAIRASRVDVNKILNDSGRSATESRRGRWLRNGLVVAQVALTLILMTGAGLMAKTLVQLSRVDPGFDAQNLITMSVRLPRSADESFERWNLFWDSLIERTRGLVGVENAAVVQPLPLSDSSFSTRIQLPGAAAADPEANPMAGYLTVSRDYFRLMGIRLLRGREFKDSDRAGTAPVIVVTESFARKFFPGQEAIGQTLVVDVGMRFAQSVTVVGVVSDTRMRLDKEPRPQLYKLSSQFPTPMTYLVARTRANPGALAAAMRDAVFSMNRNQPVGVIRTMDDIWAGYAVAPRFYLALLGSFALLAVTLATVGVYGALSQTVSRRTREIGIRMALGARGLDVRRMVLRQGAALALVGVAVGIGGALALTRLMKGLLFDVSATDPLTFIAVAALLVVVTLSACYLPARRATRVDPMVTLRAG